jgi:hypothetical protein
VTKIIQQTFYAFSIVCVLVLFSAESTHAYLDPGTGSMILQGVIAGFAIVSVVCKLYWSRLLRLFGFRKDKPTEGDDDDGEQKIS